MRLFLINAFVMLLCLSCEDIIEDDISADTVKITHPTDNYNSKNPTITFLWEDIKGADFFQIQVVKGKFDSIVRFVLDSNLSGNRFEYTFDPGQYQWRLRAKNSVSATSFISRSFTVDSTNNLSNVTLILISPLAGLSSSTSKTFAWNPIFSATEYIIQIKEDSWSSGQIVFTDTLTASSIQINNILGSKKYAWGVKAINLESETLYSIATFEIDTIKPLPPKLIDPENQTTTPLIGPTVNFKWSAGEDENVFKDSIYVYSNPSLTNIVSSEEVIGESFTDSLVSGTYYWRVKSIDKVGNQGHFSEDWTFRIL